MSTAIESLVNKEYPYGFVTDVESETIPKGLNEDVVRLISQKKNEPEWLLEWRLKAYRMWLTMKEPTWQNVKFDPINYQDIVYYSAPKKKLKSLDAVRDELGQPYGDRLLSLVMLNVLDEKWKDHLYDLDQLRNAIHYRSWGQKDPLIEYKQ